MKFLAGIAVGIIFCGSYLGTPPEDIYYIRTPATFYLIGYFLYYILFYDDKDYQNDDKKV